MSDRPSAPVVDLFEEYCREREHGREPDVDELLARAGPEREDLAARIRVFDELDGLSDQLEADVELAQTPRTLGRFEILGTLGAGGLGRVYLAHDPQLDRRVALKILGRGLGLEREERAWILNEARSLARLEHPGVVRVFDVGTAEECDFVAMEHVDGPSLAEVILHLSFLDGRPAPTGGNERPRAQVVAESLRTVRARTACLQRLAAALAYCHNRGVIHRDVKPENVLFDESGEPKLIDFGLAHQIDSEESSRPEITRQLIGSAAYVAPEQVEHGRTGADPRSDQFSFCTLCYELLALQNPFPGATTTQTMRAVARSEPRLLRRITHAVPADLERVVHHGLQREPDERYPTVHALADDLAAVLEHRPISVAPPSTARRLLLWSRRNRRLVVAGGAILMLAGAFLVGGWITRTVREESRIQGELAKIDVEALGNTRGLFEAALKLNGLQGDAAIFDAGLGHPWLAGRLGDDVDTTVRAWSRRLGEAFEHARRDGAEVGVWPFLFDLEERLCPDCPYNLDSRERGKVFLPLDELDGLESTLLRMGHLAEERAMFTTYQPVDVVEKLPPGTYRFRVWEPGAASLRAEVDFVVEEEWGEPLRIALVPPRSELLAEAVLVLRRELDLAQLVPRTPSGRLIVPAFQISERAVTTGEFRRFLAETGWTPGDFADDRAADEAAWVDLDSAGAYATWAGARLPSLVELYLALHDEVVPVPETPRLREWLGDLHWMNETSGAFFLPGEFRDTGRIDRCFAMNPAREAIPWDEEVGVQFRVVFPADAPALYRRVAGATDPP